MITCTIYNRHSGEYVQFLTAPDRDGIALNVGPDQVAVDGYWDERTYLKDGSVRSIPDKPDGNFWTFDFSLERWIDQRTPAEVDADLLMLRKSGVAEITAIRGKARLAYITDLPGQDMLYIAKNEEARAYLSDPSPNPDDYPLITSEVGITAQTGYEVAQVFANLNALWRHAAGSLDAVCFQAEAAVMQAPDETTINAIVSSLAAATLGAA